MLAMMSRRRWLFAALLVTMLVLISITLFVTSEPPPVSNNTTSSRHLNKISQVTIKSANLTLTLLKTVTPFRVFIVLQTVMLVAAVVIIVWLLLRKPESTIATVDTVEQSEPESIREETEAEKRTFNSRVYISITIAVLVLLVLIGVVYIRARSKDKIKDQAKRDHVKSPKVQRKARVYAAPDRKGADLGPEDHDRDLQLAMAISLENDDGISEPPFTRLPLTTGTRTPSGLVNYGNTCFMNSVLQCLSYVGVHHKAQSTAGLEGDLLHTLAAIEAGGHVVEPTRMNDRLSALIPAHAHSRQEDAHEFLTNLLDKSPSIKADLQFDMLSELTGACGHSSSTVEPYTFLQLQIDEVSVTVSQLLHRYLQPEELGTDWECDGCKPTRVHATKQLSITQAPRVLILQLVRFGFDGRSTKNKSPIGADFELEVAGRWYELRAAVLHRGESVHNGHYVALLRGAGEKFVVADDEEFYGTDEGALMMAYILFYVQRRT